jgi:hypothetical protein
MRVTLDLASLKQVETPPLSTIPGSPGSNTVPKVSHSQVQTFLACRKKWQYNYLRGWIPQLPPPAMAMGDFMHSFLDIYYQMLKDNPTDSPQDLWNTLETVIVEELKEDGSNGEDVLRALKALNRYVLEVAPRIDAGIQVIGSELHFEAPLTTPKGRTFLLEGYVDLLYYDREGKIRVRDHKTTGKANGFWSKKHIEKDPQQSTYIAGLRALGTDVFMGEVNEIVTFNYKNYMAEPIDKLFRTTPAFRTNELLDGNVRWYGRVVDAMIDEDQFLESIEKGRCSYCFYEGPCSLQQQGKSDEQLLQIGFKRKDGWSEHHASNQAS